MRTVFDTNIYISGIFWKGIPRNLLRRATAGDMDLLVSKDILEELKTALWRDFDVQPDDINDILDNVVQISEVIEVKSNFTVIDDIDDNKILACAIDGKAKYLVSGDRHLLNLGGYRGVKIIRASEMMKIIG